MTKREITEDDGLDFLDELLQDGDPMGGKTTRSSEDNKYTSVPSPIYFPEAPKIVEKAKEEKQDREKVEKVYVEEDDDLFLVTDDGEYEEEEIEEEPSAPDTVFSKDPSTIAKDMQHIPVWNPPMPRSNETEIMSEWNTNGWVGFLHIDKILTDGILSKASDVHIAADLKIAMTINGDIFRFDEYPVPDDETLNLLVHDGILSHTQQQQLNVEYEYEGAYTLRYGPFAGRRTRLTIGKTFGKYFLVFRIINEVIPQLSELGVEEELVKWSHYPNGLFLLCGPTGSGKSTTLASIVQNLQVTKPLKIISIEKPIEYVYPDRGPALVVQRDVGEDTRGFYNGLTSAMRQSPNVILLGEVRNTEEVQELLRAAETGHLAISTMHTNSVATTINRIQSLFSGNEQARIMSTLADTLRGIGNQVLVKRADGKGRFAVRELLTINQEIKNMIISGDIQGIRDYQRARKSTMEDKLAEAVKQGLCTVEDAKGHVGNPEYFDELIRDMNLQ